MRRAYGFPLTELRAAKADEDPDAAKHFMRGFFGAATSQYTDIWHGINFMKVIKLTMIEDLFFSKIFLFQYLFIGPHVAKTPEYGILPY